MKMEFDSFITHQIDLYMGKPKSGKTLIAGSYPKPLLYVSVGSDGGGRVLYHAYKSDVDKGLIRVKNLMNDRIVNGKIQSTSIEKLAGLLAELRRNDPCGFKTIVIDTVGALQDDYKAYMEFNKNGRQLSQPEWGEIGKMMLSIRDNMKRYSEETGVKFVWNCHTKELEVYETSGLNKEIRIIPDLTVNTGVKFMKDASNIFYCCRKTVYNENKEKTVKFLTYVGPHPLMDTGSRDMILPVGEFIEDFNYDKWQRMVESGELHPADLVIIEQQNAENKEGDNNND